MHVRALWYIRFWTIFSLERVFLRQKFVPIISCTFYNATESTATANDPTASCATRPTTEISPVLVQQAQPISVTNNSATKIKSWFIETSCPDE